MIKWHKREGGYERHLVYFIIQRGNYFSIIKTILCKRIFVAPPLNFDLPEVFTRQKILLVKPNQNNLLLLIYLLNFCIVFFISYWLLFCIASQMFISLENIALSPLKTIAQRLKTMVIYKRRYKGAIEKRTEFLLQYWKKGQSKL